MPKFVPNDLPSKLLGLALGAIYPAAFAPVGIYGIAFLSLAGLFYLCHKTSAAQTFMLSYLFGFACFGVGVNWLHISINLFGGVNLAGALSITYLLIAFLALFPACFMWLGKALFANAAIYTFPFLWVIAEWTRGWAFTGFPWLNAGTSQTDSLLASFIPVVGDYGVSLLVAFIATSIAIIVVGSGIQKLVATAIIIICTLAAYLLGTTHWSKPVGEALDVALLQAAIPQELKWQPQQRQPTLELYSQLTKPYWDYDIVIWPETAIPSVYHRADDFIERITKDKAGRQGVFMSGIAYQDLQTRQYYNSILLIDDEHRFYHKQQLVPFGEYLPLKSLLDHVLRFLQIPMSDFSPGNDSMKIMETGKAVLGMSICYEDAYSSQIRKSMPAAELLVNVSNDAWFGDSLAPHQHLQIARVRAMENERFLLRATNTGISAIIDPEGNIAARSPQFEPHALTGTIMRYQGETPFSRWGNLPVLGSSCLMLLLFAMSMFRKSGGRH